MGAVKRRIVTFLLLAVFAAGVALLAYPTVADYWNSIYQSHAVSTYADTVAKMRPGKFDQIWDAADGYNERIVEHGVNWSMTEADRKDYAGQLAVDTTGIMGYISIDKIDVLLPVYHGTEEKELQMGIGHVEWTSLPVGGPGTHSVLSGHRGLPSSRLFSDLNKLVSGDIFQLTVLNRTLSYQVDQVRIVEPDQIGDLRVEPGQDLCTLVTCTPYGINSHRLLVRGHRVQNPHGDAKIVADALQVEPVLVAPAIGVPILAVLTVCFLLSTRKGLLQREREAQARQRDHERAAQRRLDRRRRREARAGRKPTG